MLHLGKRRWPDGDGRGRARYGRCPVSTRRLILAALLCGIAILVAGGIQLLVLAGRGDQRAPDALLGLGTAATVEGVRATVVSSHPSTDRLELEVEMSSTSAVDDAAEGWVLLSRSGTRLEARPPASEACDGLAVGSDPVRCRLGFAPPAEGGTTVAVYARGSRRASWTVPG